ncbi:MULTISPECIES: PRTRC system protein C [Marinobacter]|uniref:PRTRC system protein C n=1 Tax=Marinobacter TaxID=2742 RepID=UPI0002FCDEBC|nr:MULTISPECIES: PRTRC system protein C [Marinobacter]|tara:strand:- start:39 stop:248 length:210 start_codon:yes stop_codon:yes gene_type:complete
MAQATVLTRAFRFGATDLPDPDSDLTPDQVLEFYKDQYPTLRFGKVNEIGIENDQLVYQLVPNEYHANG